MLGIGPWLMAAEESFLDWTQLNTIAAEAQAYQVILKDFNCYRFSVCQLWKQANPSHTSFRQVP